MPEDPVQSGKRLGAAQVMLCFTSPVCAGAIWVALPPNCQLVGQVLPFEILMGNPLVQRAKPESCQPPMMALANPLTPLAIAFPLPKGSSRMKFVFNWGVVAKSETPRN